MKQDESNGDLKFTATIGIGGNSTSYWKSDRIKSWKWRGICRAYKNPISEFDVRQTSFENKRKAWGEHVIFTTRNGTAWRID
jgi:hypothetical protein